MKNLSTYKSVFFLFCILVLATSCSKEDSHNEQGAMVSVKIKGASDDVSQILLDIEEVQLLVGDNEFDSNSWISLDMATTGIYNLSQYADESELLLVDNTLIAAGQIKKIKLILGVENSIMINNEKKNLVSYNTELASSNIVSTTLQANKGYEFVMEFEADNSIIMSESEIGFEPEMNTMMRHIKF